MVNFKLRSKSIAVMDVEADWDQLNDIIEQYNPKMDGYQYMSLGENFYRVIIIRDFDQLKACLMAYDIEITFYHRPPEGSILFTIFSEANYKNVINAIKRHIALEGYHFIKHEEKYDMIQVRFL